jgi:hypothetical protein
LPLKIHARILRVQQCANRLAGRHQLVQ